MTALALWLLATIDSGASGYRAAAGRNALVRKRAYFLCAVARGALVAQALLAAALAAALVGAAAMDRASLQTDARAFASRLLQVYLPYTAVMACALLVRAAPSVDFRALTSALVFGPLTLLRPAVAVAGLVWAGLHVPRPALIAWATAVVAVMLLMERLLGARAAARVA
jgi:hypothetical protein